MHVFWDKIYIMNSIGKRQTKFEIESFGSYKAAGKWQALLPPTFLFDVLPGSDIK